MSHELREGVKLRTVFWSNEESVSVGRGSCVSITVREQPGQMGMVPWAESVTKNGQTYLYNLANVEGVAVLDRREQE